MVTYAQLSSMDTSKLTTAAGSAGSLSSSLSTRAGEVNSAADIPGGTWDGLDATAAGDLIGRQPPPLYDASDAFQRGRTALEDLADEIGTAKERLQDAHELIAGTGITIGGDGTVTTPVVDSQETAQRNDGIAKQATAIINQALQMANTADQTAVAALQSIGTKVNPDDIPNGKGDSPADVKKWWDGLTKEQQQAYINDHSKEIGNLDGIPADARDQANRIALDDAVAEKKKRLQEIADSGLINAPGASDLRSEKEQLEGELARLGVLDKRLDANKDYMLLGLDPDGDGKAIIATGNPDEADNTVTFVPGTGADLGRINGEMNRVDRMVYDANQLDPDKNTVGLMWLDWDAPDGPANAMSPGYASDAGDDLSKFQEGLRAGNPDSYNTVVGHSYGTTVMGNASSEHGMDADNMVFVASPGVGDAGNVGDLNTNADVYATRTDKDWINSWWANLGTSRLGGDPMSPGFGAETFDADPDGNHSDYWWGTEDGRDSNNEARDNMAKIITGDGDNVTDTREAPTPSPSPGPMPSAPPTPEPDPSPQPSPSPSPGPSPTPR
ncbi:MAG: alpha/beta hydrolase [Stackebrandtia sp.]